MNVETILNQAIAAAGGAGLCTHSCGCMVGDLMTCGEYSPECHIAIQQTVTFDPPSPNPRDAEARLTEVLCDITPAGCVVFCVWGGDGKTASILLPHDATVAIEYCKSHRVGEVAYVKRSRLNNTKEGKQVNNDLSVIQLVKKAIREAGGDGLVSDECGCELDDLHPCGESFANCRVASKRMMDEEEAHGLGWREGAPQAFVMRAIDLSDRIKASKERGQ